jgi:hypothetical protein
MIDRGADGTHSRVGPSLSPQTCRTPRADLGSAIQGILNVNSTAPSQSRIIVPVCSCARRRGSRELEQPRIVGNWPRESKGGIIEISSAAGGVPYEPASGRTYKALDALHRNIDPLFGRALLTKSTCQPRAANDCCIPDAALLTQGIHRPVRSRNFIQA